MNNKIRNFFIIGGFCLFLLIALAAGLLREKESYSYYENRNLADKPVLTAENVLSGAYFTALDAYLTDQAPGRNTLLKLDTFLNLRVLHRPVVNQVVVGEDILLPFNSYDMFDMDAIPQNVEAMVENLVSVRDAAASVGAVYYYVAVPCQYAYFQEAYPWYLNSNAAYSEASRAALRDALEQVGVGYLDIGEVFAAMGSPRELGSTVDNHYPLYGGFLACRAVLDRVNADTGLHIPVLEESEVTFTELPNRYLGSRNRKLLGLWTNDEKLTYMTYARSVPFRRWNNGVEVEGSVYAWPASPWEDVTYSFYMGGDIARTVIDTGRDELPRILIYGDSFTNAMECVLYLSFHEMCSLDLRYYTEKTLEQVIGEFEPDVVICVRDYEALLSPFGNGKGARE